MRYRRLICAVLLLALAFGNNGLPISNNNGYIHMSADSPDLMAVYETDMLSIYGTPSIKLPLNLTESVRAGGDISIEFRLKIFAVEDYPQVLLAPTYHEPPGGAYRSPHLYYGNDSRVYFIFYDGDGGPARSNPVNLVDGEWHMISAVLSKSANTYIIFIDGKSETAEQRVPGEYTWVPAESPPPHVHLIASGGCKSNLPDWPGTRDGISECFFNGYIDEFRIWSKALNLEDVQRNLHANLFGDEPDLAYVLPFDQLESSNFPIEYFTGDTPGDRSYLVRRPNGGGYNQTMVFIPSNITVDTVFEDLNETHAQTWLYYNNPSSVNEFHPFGRNNYFMIDGTRVLDLGQLEVIEPGTSRSLIIWRKNITTFTYKIGNLAALSMFASTIVPPVSDAPLEQAPVAAVIPNPDAPAPGDNTVAIAVGVTVPVVVVAAGAVVLAVLLVRKRQKAEKEKTFADKQGAIIQSRKVEILNKIGSGSFGDVWKGVWKGKEVAVKEVKSGADASFLNEIKIMAKLPPHENVMEVYGAIIDADSPSLVLEFCGGGSLDFLLYDTEEAVSEEFMLNLALGIARGMEHLHKYNIVHRDLAARNVLLTTAHVPKICDFGMSRTVAERNISNKTKTDMGPIRWMAPEALAGEYSIKTDIWSYGIVLSEITSRTEPHTDVDPLKIALQIRDEKMTPKIAENCPPALADIMKMCWNPNPSERPEFSKIVELLELVVQKK